MWRSKKPQSLINHQHSLFSTSRDPAFLGYMNVTKFWPRKVGDGRIATREVRGRGKRSEVAKPQSKNVMCPFKLILLLIFISFVYLENLLQLTSEYKVKK